MFTSAGRGIAAGPPIVGPTVDKALDAIVAAPGAIVGYKAAPRGLRGDARRCGPDAAAEPEGLHGRQRGGERHLDASP